MDSDIALVLKKARIVKAQLELLERTTEISRALLNTYKTLSPYYTVTGEQPDEATVEALVTTGEGEQFLQKAIAEQGQGTVMNMVAEIQERHNTVTDLERSLLELHQVFMDMAVLVQTQGEQLNDIENQVGRAKSFVEDGRQSLQVARKLQKNTHKWTCFAILLLLIIVLAIVLPIVLKH
ncbi:syntaxin-121-like protein [Carex littledalei]|uniref:Syntaxin-121-like protein n=1 Tax=Carex littledalei TaxID=544730 RepID=A0A833QIW5_9POAL|nr:syntaxin-121-like protein [Carex littledalei]